MAASHVEEQGGEERNLHDGIEPGLSHEDGRVERDGAAVEGQDVGQGHQRQTASAKVLTQALGDGRAGICLVNGGQEMLGARRHPFLRGRVVAVEIEKDFPHGVVLPSQCHKLLCEFARVVQFAAAFALEEEEVDVAIVVGQGALFAVTQEAGYGAKHPDPESPSRRQAQADGGIDAEEPHVARKAVEHAAEACLLSRHAGQLAVARIVDVCPDEEQDAQHVEAEVFKVEQYARCCAKDDA